VDRLDYTKGLTNRLLAFEKLLEEHPEYLEKIILLQVRMMIEEVKKKIQYKLLCKGRGAVEDRREGVH